ncbi:MAG: hypothetical protein WAU07_00130 [Microgenomates group bacterium]
MHEPGVEKTQQNQPEPYNELEILKRLKRAALVSKNGVAKRESDEARVRVISFSDQSETQ